MAKRIEHYINELRAGNTTASHELQTTTELPPTSIDSMQRHLQRTAEDPDIIDALVYYQQVVGKDLGILTSFVHPTPDFPAGVRMIQLTLNQPQIDIRRGTGSQRALEHHDQLQMFGQFALLTLTYRARQAHGTEDVVVYRDQNSVAKYLPYHAPEGFGMTFNHICFGIDNNFIGNFIPNPNLDPKDVPVLNTKEALMYYMASLVVQNRPNG